MQLTGRDQMTIPRSQRFCRQHPCPICGGDDGKPRGEGRRCFGFLSSDGTYAHCTREEGASNLALNTESNTYAHRLDSDCACGVRHLQAVDTPSPRPDSKKRRIVATYDYTDAAGTLLFQVVRYEPKGFSCRRPDGQGGWIWNMKGVERVLYKFPHLLQAVKAGDTIYIAEGEKDVDAIIAAGGTATCNPGGAGKWKKEYCKGLRNANVIIVADKDDPGRNHASQVAGYLRNLGASVSIVEAKEGKDAAEHLAAGLPLEDFVPASPDSTMVEHSGQATRGGGDSLAQSQADRLVEVVEQEGVELFTDPSADCWARIPVKETFQIFRCRSKSFKQWMAGKYYQLMRKAPNSDSLGAALNVLESKARFEGEEHELFNRIAELDGAFWYDLTDRRWRAVKVSPTGWQVVADPPILFRRHSHQKPQVDPVGGGDLHRLLDFVNLRDDAQRLLFLVYVVACLVPDIPHPIPVLHGGQGCAKTTLFRVVRRLVDPSITETLTMAHDNREFIQQLAHHWMPLFDNLSTLSDWVSDALCRAATGDGFSKRELYTDDDDIIYSFRRCIGLNGINIAAHKPDLLDRSILFGLEPIDPKNRKPEKQFGIDFDRQRPALFGAMLDALSKAMALRPTIRVEGLPRMADFALWGCAIAIALGHPQEEFLAAFDANFRVRNDEVLASNPVAAAVSAFMEGHVTWKGNASELLSELVNVAGRIQLDTKARTWPKAPHALTRRLNEVRHNLAVAGITVTTGGMNRMLALQRAPGNSVSTVDSVEAPKRRGESTVGSHDAISGDHQIASPEALRQSLPSGATKDAINASDAISRTSGPSPSDVSQPDLEVFDL